MDSVLAPILQSPRLKHYVEELNAYMKSEDAKRINFYKTIAEQQKVEFINGEIIFQSPVILKHNFIVVRLSRLLSTYVSVRKLGFVGIEKILIKLTRNDFEPDICFFKKEIADSFSDKTMFFPAPNFVVEVLSKSTEKRDRTVKMDDYALHGVNEYWIIDTEKEIIEQYILQEDVFELFVKMNEGNIYCKTITGFDIPVAALFDEMVCNETLKKLL